MTERAALANARLESFVASLLATGDSSAVLDPVAAKVFGALAQAHVDALLLKGPALAQLLYQPGEHRAYVDIDLLVPPSDVGRATEVLTALGYQNNAHEQRGIDDVGGVVHADTWFAPFGERDQIDLHRRLAGVRGGPDAAWEALWRRRTEIEVAGRSVPVLDREGQALHLALHAAQHGPGYFKGTSELALALERWDRGVWDAARVLSAEIGADAAFAAGLRLVPKGARLAAELGMPIDAALEWEIAHRTERPRGTFHVEAWRSADGVAARASLLRRALFPDRAWLAIEYHWSERGGLWVALAYALHLLRTPVWAAKAWVFRQRARRAYDAQKRTPA